MGVTSLTAEAASLFSRSSMFFSREKGQSSPENVPRRLFICLGTVAAGLADEQWLADAVLVGGVPAGFAPVGGVPGVHVNDSPPSLFRFGLEDVDEGRPARVMDGSIQPGLGRCPVGQELSRLIGVWPGLRPTDHIRYVHGLYEEDVEISHQLAGFLVVPVAALVGDLAMPCRERLFGGMSVVGASLLAG